MGIGQWAYWDKKLTTMSDNLWYWGCVFLIEKFRGITNKFFFYQGKFLFKKRGKTQHGGRTENWNGVQSLFSS